MMGWVAAPGVEVALAGLVLMGAASCTGLISKVELPEDNRWHLCDSCQFIAGGLQLDELPPFVERMTPRSPDVRHRFRDGENETMRNGRDKGLANLSPKRIILLTQPEDLFARP